MASGRVPMTRQTRCAAAGWDMRGRKAGGHEAYGWAPARRPIRSAGRTSAPQRGHAAGREGHMLVAPGRLRGLCRRMRLGGLWALGPWALGREPWAQGLTRLLDSAMLMIWRYTRPLGGVSVGSSICTTISAICGREPYGPPEGVGAVGSTHTTSRDPPIARCTGLTVYDDVRLPTSNAANLTSVTESAVLCVWRAWVPTRAPAASAPGGSGWIPVSRKGEVTGPADFLLVHFSSKIGAAQASRRRELC